MKKWFPIFFILIFFQVQSEPKQLDPEKLLTGQLGQPSTVCLNMIVKNESKVIERCLRSVKNFINYWVIVDTGSTDGTQEIITNFMKDIPGKLYQSEWVNFEHNRNEALEYARDKADYILFIDADEELLFPKDFCWGVLDKDCYKIQTEIAGMKYFRLQLVSNKKEWKWIGVMHEYIDCPGSKTDDILNGVINCARPEGCRSQDPQTFFKDAAILEKALEKDPDNTRNVFYLAQSYFASFQHEKALKTYERRSKMGGNREEVFYSLYRIGFLQDLMKMSPAVILKSYTKAFFHSPERSEPLYHMALFYRKINDFKRGYDLMKLALSIPYPASAMFVEEWVYSFGILLECALDAHYLGNYEESKKIYELVLQKKDLPENVREGVRKNLQIADFMIGMDIKKNLIELVSSYNDKIVK